MRNKYLTPIIAAAGLLGSHAANSTPISIVPSSPLAGPILVQAPYPGTQGTYVPFTNTRNIALGRTVTASGTIAGFPTIHNAANVTDGNYGNGRSWITDGSNPTPSLIIDLGAIAAFDTISFGRDRLGFWPDRNPRQFSISISNDNSLYTQIFDSSLYGFSGVLGVGQTVQASLGQVSAEYVKLQFTNPLVAIDEVEITLIPEPATLALMGLGLAGIGSHRKRAAMAAR